MSRPSLSGRRASYSATSLPAISEDDTAVGGPHHPPYNEVEPIVHRDWPRKPPINFKQEPDRSPGEDERPKPKGWFGRQLAKRGGWIRFLVAFIIILSLVALGIGLGVGLPTRHSNDALAETKAKTAAEQQAPEKAFPEGTYRFETVLESISTDCTSDNSTYRCYPYASYSQSPDSSMAVFDWVIQAEDHESNNYQISSTRNPFSIVFSNATLNLQGAGTENERFDFSVPLNVTVIPDKPLDTRNTNRASICYYSDVVFSASIYTKKAKSWPAATERSQSQNPKRWPYAAMMKQAVASGPNVPNCLDASSHPMGNFAVNGTAECSCAYTNSGI